MGFAEAISAGELGHATGFFAEDARFLMGDGRPRRGPGGDPPGPGAADRQTADDAVEIKRMIETPRGAIGSERWVMSFEDDGGKPIEQSGRSTVVFAHAAEGWEILIDAPWGLTPNGQSQRIEEHVAAARKALYEDRRWFEEVADDDALGRAAGLFAIHAGTAGWRRSASATHRTIGLSTLAWRAVGPPRAV